jgi:GNAT superfamily N-acetyltransferase
MNITLTATASLHPLALPARADAPDAGEFRELARIRNLVYREITGRDEQDLTPEALLPLLRTNKARLTQVWAVRAEGELVGRAVVNIPQEEESRLAIASIEILPRVWGRGIGTAILPHLEAFARAHGRTVIQEWVEQQADDGPRMRAATGFGSVPNDHVARFLTRHGFTLKQVYRVSVLEIDATTRTKARALLAQAQAASIGYRIVQWTAPTSVERLAGYAWMKSRMSTDAPSAGLDVDEETWDAERVIEGEKRLAEMRQTMLVTAAQHMETGELAAFNELAIGPDLRATTLQHDTLVLKKHRGHRLGQLVKCTALLTWPEIAPESPRIITYNAEENRHMLSINEAMDFFPVAYEGAWKKELT